MTDATAAAMEAPAPSEDDAMAAIYDRITAESPVEQEAAVAEVAAEAAPVETEPAKPEPEAEAEGEPEPEKVEPPTELPAAVKAKWAEIPPEARDAVLSAHRDMSRKLAEQGRVVQASKPVFDVLVQAAKEIPTLADMTPDAIARDVFQMAKIQGDLARDPVGTILRVAQQYGALDGIRQAVTGQAPDATAQQNIELVQEVRSLRAQLAKVADPTLIKDRVTQTLTARETERMVFDYATSKEHWQDVETVIAQIIPVAQQRLGPGASAKDVLDAAYDMAIHAIPDLRAKVQTAATPAPAQPDPARTAAAVKAKSVNVTSRPTGNNRAMTEDERLSAIWDKHNS